MTPSPLSEMTKALEGVESRTQGVIRALALPTSNTGVDGSSIATKGQADE